MIFWEAHKIQHGPMVLGSLFAQEDSHATTAWLLIGKKGIHFHLAG